MPTSNTTTTAQVVSFTIGGEQYGVDINAVREIKGWTKITPLPNQHEYVRGVLNLRGAMVPIIDLRCRFDDGLTQVTPAHVVIVVQIGGKLLGILADKVLDIVSIDADDIKAVPNVTQDEQVALLSGLTTTEGATLALINLENLSQNVSRPQARAR